MKFVRYQPDMEVEREYEEQKPNASLCGAAVLILLGAGLMILARKEYRRDEA